MSSLYLNSSGISHFVPVETSFSRDHMDVDCLHEWQHCQALSISVVSSHLIRWWSFQTCTLHSRSQQTSNELQEYGKQVVFKSGQLLCLVLSKLKIPCQWSSSPRSCIGNLAEVARPISGRPEGSSRLREHQDACKRGTLKKLAVAEPVKWE